LPYTALNGGPQFKFTEAVSFQIFCENQQEIDRYWNALAQGGEEGPCGWVKDKFGLSWQVVPASLDATLRDSDAGKVGRVTKAFLQMKRHWSAPSPDVSSAGPWRARGGGACLPEACPLGSRGIIECRTSGILAEHL
jgi:hypothetical protein